MTYLGSEITFGRGEHLLFRGHRLLLLFRGQGGRSFEVFVRHVVVDLVLDVSVFEGLVQLGWGRVGFFANVGSEAEMEIMRIVKETCIYFQMRIGLFCGRKDIRSPS